MINDWGAAGPGERTARSVLVVAPVLAFETIPRTPGLVTLGMVVPLAYLGCVFVRSASAKIPLWSVALLALLALSVLWGDDPAYSVERLRTFLPLALCVCVASALLDGDRVLQSLRISFALIIGSSLVVLLLQPETREYQSQLVFHAQFDKNTYGGLLAIALLLTAVKPRRINILLIPGLLVLITLDRSVTVWIVTLIVVCLAGMGRVVFGRLGARAGTAPFVTLAACGALIAVLLVKVGNGALLELVGKDPGLSERTAIWAACWPQILRSPILGHGAYTFLDSASDSPVTQAIWLHFTQYLPPHPHSGLLDLWGQLGLVGVATYVAFTTSAVRTALRGSRLGSESAVTALLGITFLVIFGSTEPTYLGSWSVLTFAFAGMGVGVGGRNVVRPTAGHPISSHVVEEPVHAIGN